MKFTYCLVTKGRADFLPFTLASLKTTLDYADVQVIIIDNGCPKEVSEMLITWCQNAGPHAHYLRFEVNDPAAQRNWSSLQAFRIEWITFPGDDDIVRPEFLDSARAIIQRNHDISALASSMRIIDSSGISTGQIRKPLAFTGDRVVYLASSLHEPPFLFPALFLKFNAVQASLPNSRYIFDWWLSLHLISIGVIETSEEVAIDYRVHDDQESFIAPNRRKFFEAQIVLSRFIETDTFSNFLIQLSDLEKLRFWNHISLHRPIYGDSEFGKSILFQILLKIVDSTENSNFAAEIMGDYAAEVGTFLSPGEVRHFLSNSIQPTESLPGNFKLVVADGSCASIFRLANMGESRAVPVHLISVGCKHSTTVPDASLECQSLFDSGRLDLDSILVEITNALEMNGGFDFKISPFERKLVSVFRGIKTKTPRKVFGLIGRKIHNSHNKSEYRPDSTV